MIRVYEIRSWRCSTVRCLWCRPMNHVDAHEPSWCPCSRSRQLLFILSGREELLKSVSAVDDRGYWKTTHVAAVPACLLVEVSTLQDPSVSCHVGVFHRDVLGATTPASFKFLIVVIAVSMIGSCHWHFLPRKPLYQQEYVCSRQLLEELTWEGLVLVCGSRKVEYLMVEKAKHGRRSWVLLVFSSAYSKQAGGRGTGRQGTGAML